MLPEQGRVYKMTKSKEGIIDVGTGFSGVASLPSLEPPQGEPTMPAFEER